MNNAVIWDNNPVRTSQETHYVPAAEPSHVRFEVFTPVTMKGVVFWDIKNPFVPHTKHITFPLESPAV
jgi:hypothetical protein